MMIAKTLRNAETTQTWTLEQLHPESATFRVRGRDGARRRTAYRINITRRCLSEMLVAGELVARTRIFSR